jgi:aminopeptidase
MEYISELIVHHSLCLKRGERVLIDVIGQPEEFIKELVNCVYKIGAEPIVQYFPVGLMKSLISGVSPGQLAFWVKNQLNLLENVQAYVSIREEENSYEYYDLPDDTYKLYVSQYVKPTQMKALGLERWLLLKLPTAGMAQKAKLSTEGLNRLFYNSISMNYREFASKVQPLADRLSHTDRVRIVSPYTDLQFSIKGIPNLICDGKFNLPDGEIFTAPVLNTVQGEIRFNISTTFLGRVYSDIQLEFNKGKLVKATGNCPDDIMALLSTDEGASRIGEFGIGLNPYIQQPTNNLCFDEKMAGSVHLAMGQCFSLASNGNESSIHIDFVLCQLESFGGGEMYFDDKLVRKNGLFIEPELQYLNDD